MLAQQSFALAPQQPAQATEANLKVTKVDTSSPTKPQSQLPNEQEPEELMKYLFELILQLEKDDICDEMKIV